MTNPYLQGLLQKEVSRKEFLGLLALGIGSIFGMEHIIKLLTGKSLTNHKLLSQDGYSSSVYGGGKD
jgi:hypothetical protein